MKHYWDKFKKPASIPIEDHKTTYFSIRIAIKNEGCLTRPHRTEDLRKILNYGHTLGHAVESYSLRTTKRNGNPYLHGEAIAIGMILEGYLSYKLTGLSME